MNAAKAYGLPGNDDFNGAVQDGVGFYQVTQHSGRRWSAADAYLQPAIGRANLTVETGALVTRVLIEDGRAGGLRYRRYGAELQARTGREVILCGGAVGSPHLLLLSGIGPATHLRERAIDVIVDAPQVAACRTIGSACRCCARQAPATCWRRRRPTTWNCGGGKGEGRPPTAGWIRSHCPSDGTRRAGSRRRPGRAAEVRRAGVPGWPMRSATR